MQQKMKLQETRGACLPQQSLEQSLCMGRRLLQFMADCIPTWRAWEFEIRGQKAAFAPSFKFVLKSIIF